MRICQNDNRVKPTFEEIKIVVMGSGWGGEHLLGSLFHKVAVLRKKPSK